MQDALAERWKQAIGHMTEIFVKLNLLFIYQLGKRAANKLEFI